MQDFAGVNWVPSPVSVRLGNIRDVNYIKDIDLKSYQYPWPDESWFTLGDEETHHWCVATRRAEPIGFAVWQDHPQAVELHRIAVKPPEQRKGVGTQLVKYVCDYAKERYRGRIVTVVPEINCLPNDPDDVSGWLLKLGFKAEAPILRDHVRRYGRLVDCYTFALELR
jgi:GNAT superfamily N-acetyltransferase